METPSSPPRGHAASHATSPCLRAPSWLPAQPHGSPGAEPSAGSSPELTASCRNRADTVTRSGHKLGRGTGAGLTRLGVAGGAPAQHVLETEEGGGPLHPEPFLGPVSPHLDETSEAPRGDLPGDLQVPAGRAVLLFHKRCSSLITELLKTVPFGKSGLDSSPVLGSDIKRRNCEHRSPAGIMRVISPDPGPLSLGSCESSVGIIQLALEVARREGTACHTPCTAGELEPRGLRHLLRSHGVGSCALFVLTAGTGRAAAARDSCPTSGRTALASPRGARGTANPAPTRPHPAVLESSPTR